MNGYNSDISKPFRQLGEQVKNLPKISIGGTQQPVENKYQQQKPMFQPHEEEILAKIKKWMFLLAVTVVILYAAYRILFG